jgi:tRNA (guanine37-N1)-methyltransferase
MLDSYLGESILARAQADKKIKITTYNPRHNTKDKHGKVDDRPYAGGPGMVMTAQPILDTVKQIMKKKKNAKWKVIIFAPRGKMFTNTYATQVVKKYTDIILICGRYEGVDARVKKILKAEEISIGEYVLTGGELPAMILIDAIARQIPGVLGKTESLEESRVASTELYTRPPELIWEKKVHKVPKILLSGDHKKIEEWKKDKISK